MSMSEERVRRRLAAIMAAQVVGFNRLMEANEEGTLAALREHRRAFFDPTIARHDGRIFKAMGDSFLIEFTSAVAAAQCAIALQRGMAERNAGLPDDRRIRFRIGLNLGDVIVQGDDFYGDDVNIAARLVGLAQPGGIACSARIRQQIGHKLDIAFLDQGEKPVKNIAQPVHVYFIDPDRAKTPPGRAEEPAAKPRYRPDKPSVAVLPFVNMSGDPEQDYFSDGMTEDIITDLSKVSELFVLSRNTVFRYKGKAANMEKIASELGVAYLVHGSVRKSGSKVRITAQLTEGASGGQVWAERYDRDLVDIFDLQDEITKAVVAQLRVKLLPRERKAIERAPTRSVEAYTYYLRGRENFLRGSKTHYLIAKRMFSKAIEIDPNYAKAYAGLADCDAFLYMDYSEDVATDVLRNSEKALALAGDLVEAHASRALALSIQRRYAEAEAEFERAVSMNPNHFETQFFYGRCLYAQGKFEDTAKHWERAAEIKSDDYQAPILLNQVYASLGQTQNAMRAGLRGVERAEREFAKNPDNPRPAYFIATTLAKLGEVKRAEEWARRALAIAPDDFLTLYNIACFYSAAGKIDQAFELIQRLLPFCNDDMKQWMLSDSDLDPLHADRRWREVTALARAG
jgi:adenylate cyclase